ncbi:MAG: tetratricopeptide repeat protein [Flavobacteriales bacterium]
MSSPIIKLTFAQLVLLATCVSTYSDVMSSPFYAIEIFDGGKLNLQLLRVKNMMSSGDYNSALRLLRDLQRQYPENAEVVFRLGECHYALKNYGESVEALEKSIKLNPVENPWKYVLLGNCMKEKNDLKAAIEAYEQFFKFNKKSDKYYTDQAIQLLSQARRAEEVIANPVNVKIKNLGEAINSEFPEYNPSISADGMTMIFTSRRPDTKGGGIDPEDGKYYEDIYIAYRDSQTGKWLPAEPIKGNLNTEGHDANMSISPDGNQIFVYRNLGNRGSGEIFVSKKSKSVKWAAAKPVEGGINTSYFESSACLSPDGKTLYFVSERQGGFGSGDIWKSERVGKNQWGKPVNLGKLVNDENDQIGVFIHPDGKTLYFSSDGHNSIGGYDIFKTQKDEKGNWGTPVNLGYPINTIRDERFFVLSTDGLTAYYTSNREDSFGDLDIYEIDMTFYGRDNTSEADQGQVAKNISIISGKVIDSDAGQTLEADLTITDAETGTAQAISTDEDGNYFITLEGEKQYVISVNLKGYQDFQEKVYLKKLERGTFNLSKIIVLNRIK